MLATYLFRSPANALKDKSGVVIVVDYSRNYTVVNGVVIFAFFFSFNLQNFIFQSGSAN